MATLTVQIPDALEEERNDIVQFIAAKLYEACKLTLGEAATMCSIKKWDFLPILAKYEVSYFQYTAEDVIADFETISKNTYNKPI